MGAGIWPGCSMDWICSSTGRRARDRNRIGRSKRVFWNEVLLKNILTAVSDNIIAYLHIFSNKQRIKYHSLLHRMSVLNQFSSFCDLKYSLLFCGSGMIVAAPGFHPAGQTSPCKSAQNPSLTLHPIQTPPYPYTETLVPIAKSHPHCVQQVNHSS